MTSKYSRQNLQDIVVPSLPDKFGNKMPFLDFFDASYIRSTKTLQLQGYRRVRSDEGGRLDLISYRLYKTIDLWWLIGMYNGIVNPFIEVYEGLNMKIPTLTSIGDYYKAVNEIQPTIVHLP